MLIRSLIEGIKANKKKENQSILFEKQENGKLLYFILLRCNQFTLRPVRSTRSGTMHVPIN